MDVSPTVDIKRERQLELVLWIWTGFYIWISVHLRPSLSHRVNPFLCPCTVSSTWCAGLAKVPVQLSWNTQFNTQQHFFIPLRAVKDLQRTSKSITALPKSRNDHFYKVSALLLALTSGNKKSDTTFLPGQPPCRSQGRCIPLALWRSSHPYRSSWCRSCLSAESTESISFWMTVDIQTMTKHVVFISWWVYKHLQSIII